MSFSMRGVLTGRLRRALLLSPIILAALLAAGWLLLWLIPFDASLVDKAAGESLRIVDRRGELLYEPAGAQGDRAVRLTADEIPQVVLDAVLAAEDRRFFFHPGVDPIAIARAAMKNAAAMRVVEGGSTISQQTAKLLLASGGSRTLTRKGRETLLALQLEQRLTKRELLALYLNIAPYGNRMRGLARASRGYFGVAPSELTAAQAAYLAALPQRPGAFNPLRDATRARPRQLAILARMPLSGESRARAEREALTFTKIAAPVIAMHFVERLLEREGERAGALIRSSLDAALQRDVAGIIEAHRETLLRHGARSAAVVVLDNATGEWLAWEGSGDYFGSTFGGAIDAVVTPRQPGSTLKPFTYALAFESGATPATVLADVPTHFPTAEKGVIYTPRNYDGVYRGPLRVRAALAGSENVPAVAMLSRVGPESLLRLLHRSGFSFDKTADHYGLGLTLGDAEVTLEDLVVAYSAFARGGVRVQPTMRSDVRSAAGVRTVSTRTAFWIADILSDPEARAYAFGEGGSLDFPFPVAVKTGTSQAYRDNWTVGFTREVTVGVWVGNFDRKELRGSTGVTGAAPIFNAVMLAAMKRARGMLPIGDMTPVAEPTADVELVEICALSGDRPGHYCSATTREWLPRGGIARFCEWHHDGRIDWPGEYRQWAATTYPEQRPVEEGRSVHAAAFRIANPADGATFLIDPTLRSEYQTLRLRADATTAVTWEINRKRLGRARPGEPLEWPLRPGVHTIRATDAAGRHDEVRIFVR